MRVRINTKHDRDGERDRKRRKGEKREEKVGVFRSLMFSDYSVFV